MPNIYKIGLTRRTVNERIKSLRTTAIPADFVCELQIDSEHCLKLERHLHKKLKSNRVSKGREFFLFSTKEEAISNVELFCGEFAPSEYSKPEIINIKKTLINSPSNEVKKIGLPSLQYVADKTQTHRTVLEGWFYTKPERFKAIIHGVKTLHQTTGSTK